MSRLATKGLTAAQEILFGAFDLDASMCTEFTEWDLTVATWKRNPNKFGCRGYEDQFPDHKRVMMEIMGNKKDNPVRLGRIEKTRPNHYILTDIGRSEVGRLRHLKETDQKSRRSPQAIFDAVAPFYRSPVFRKYCKNHDEPKMWLGAASFLQLSSGKPRHLDDRLRITKSAIENAINWLEENEINHIQRGVSGGSEAIPKDSLIRLQEFFTVIEDRFSNQIKAVRKTKRKVP